MQSKYTSRQKGKYAEQLAEKFLLKKGYFLITKNFYSKFGEIDLIVGNKNLINKVENLRVSKNLIKPINLINTKKITNITASAKLSASIATTNTISKPYPDNYLELVFCEVKYRSSANYGGAISSVNYHKQRKIIKTAKIFISMYNLHHYYMRFDVLCICKTGPKIKVDWFKGAFY